MPVKQAITPATTVDMITAIECAAGNGWEEVQRFQVPITRLPNGELSFGAWVPIGSYQRPATSVITDAGREMLGERPTHSNGVLAPEDKA
jgi:hypothetical protein